MKYRIQRTNYRDFSVHEQNKRIPRAYFIPYTSQEALRTTPLGDQRYESDQVTVLSGPWDFKYYKDNRELPRELDTEETAFDAITVPSTWQRTGYEPPAYINSRYEFENPPPELPESIPVGVYRKKFSLERTEGTFFIAFLGVTACVDLYCNGYHIGYSEGAHNTAEFDLTPVVQSGENELVAVVHKWSTATFLECQDMFRENGIFRDVLLYTLPGVWINDYWLRPKKTGVGEYTLQCTVEVQGELNGWSVECAVDGLDVKYTGAAKERMTFSFEKLSVAEWNPEQPFLYTAWLKLSKGGEAAQYVKIPLGFRHIEIQDNVFYYNGQKIKIKGVNHHDTHAINGYCMSFGDYVQDLRLMKQYNVNAIRTSHYPPDPHLLLLANELGFYVIDEADIETHGCIPNHGDNNLISDDKQWIPRYLDRVKCMFFRDRSHACVTMWSLGNESGGRHCQDACNAYLTAIHPEVPVHYPFVNDSKYIDEGYAVYTHMYTSHSVLADIGAGKVEKYNDKPYFLCEYAHAMGVGPGGLEEYNEIFERYDSLLGGCIWEWADHAVYHGESAGVKHPENCHLQWTYGGDHGERIHDRNFCCDGLMYPDRRPHTGALNMRNAYRPVHAAWVDGKLSFRSYYRFANATHTAAWELRHNGLGVVTGSIALDIPPMGTQEAYLQLPAFGAGDYTLVLRYLAESGEETAFEELALQEQYVAEEIASSGGLTEILSTLRLNITRAWLDNDLCSWNNVSKKALSFRVDCGPAFAMDLRTEALPGGAVKVMVRLEPYERQLPSKDAEVVRFGVTLRLPREWNQVQYYGLGETENLPDLRLAALTGVYSSTVEQMHEPYIMPQDNGNHGQCRWLALTGKDGKGVKITNAPGRFFFSAHSYSQESLDAATHQEDLRDEGTVFLSIDGFIRGAGSASCGADTQDKYKVYVQDGLEFSFVIAGLD